MLPRRGVDRRHRDVDAVPSQRNRAARAARWWPAPQPTSSTASAGAGTQTGHGVHERRLEAPRLEPPPRPEDGHRVTRPGRLPILGLQEVDVAAAGDVERVPARAGAAPLAARERPAATANGADEDDHRGSLARALPNAPIRPRGS